MAKTAKQYAAGIATRVEAGTHTLARRPAKKDTACLLCNGPLGVGDTGLFLMHTRNGRRSWVFCGSCWPALKAHLSEEVREKLPEASPPPAPSAELQLRLILDATARSAAVGDVRVSFTPWVAAEDAIVFLDAIVGAMPIRTPEHHPDTNPLLPVADKLPIFPPLLYGNGIVTDVPMVSLPPTPQPGFIMGVPEGQGHADESPQHYVILPSFSIGRAPVHQALYEAVVGTNPSHFKGRPDSPLRPVECVSWYDAIDFLNQLSSRWGLTPAYEREGDEVKRVEGADGLRLPTEEEWEYAARGLLGRRYPWGDEEPTQEHACWNRSFEQGTAPVGSYPKGATPREMVDAQGNIVAEVEPIYDLAGNVWEWTEDVYDAEAYRKKVESGRCVAVPQGGQGQGGAAPAAPGGAPPAAPAGGGAGAQARSGVLKGGHHGSVLFDVSAKRTERLDWRGDIHREQPTIEYSWGDGRTHWTSGPFKDTVEPVSWRVSTSLRLPRGKKGSGGGFSCKGGLQLAGEEETDMVEALFEVEDETILDLPPIHPTIEGPDRATRWPLQADRPCHRGASGWTYMPRQSSTRGLLDPWLYQTTNAVNYVGLRSLLSPRTWHGWRRVKGPSWKPEGWYEAGFPQWTALLEDRARDHNGFRLTDPLDGGFDALPWVLSRGTSWQRWGDPLTHRRGVAMVPTERTSKGLRVADPLDDWFDELAGRRGSSWQYPVGSRLRSFGERRVEEDAADDRGVRLADPTDGVEEHAVFRGGGHWWTIYSAFARSGHPQQTTGQAVGLRLSDPMDGYSYPTRGGHWQPDNELRDSCNRGLSWYPNWASDVQGLRLAGKPDPLEHAIKGAAWTEDPTRGSERTSFWGGDEAAGLRIRSLSRGGAFYNSTQGDGRGDYRHDTWPIEHGWGCGVRCSLSGLVGARGGGFADTVSSLRSSMSLAGVGPGGRAGFAGLRVSHTVRGSELRAGNFGSTLGWSSAETGFCAIGLPIGGQVARVTTRGRQTQCVRCRFPKQSTYRSGKAGGRRLAEGRKGYVTIKGDSGVLPTAQSCYRLRGSYPRNGTKAVGFRLARDWHPVVAIKGEGSWEDGDLGEPAAPPRVASLPRADGEIGFRGVLRGETWPLDRLDHISYRVPSRAKGKDSVGLQGLRLAASRRSGPTMLQLGTSFQDPPDESPKIRSSTDASAETGFRAIGPPIGGPVARGTSWGRQTQRVSGRFPKPPTYRSVMGGGLRVVRQAGRSGSSWYNDGCSLDWHFAEEPIDAFGDNEQGFRVAGMLRGMGSRFKDVSTWRGEAAMRRRGSAYTAPWGFRLMRPSHFTVRKTAQSGPRRMGYVSTEWYPRSDQSFRLAGNTTRGGAASGVRYARPPASLRFLLKDNWLLAGLRLVAPKLGSRGGCFASILPDLLNSGTRGNGRGQAGMASSLRLVVHSPRGASWGRLQVLRASNHGPLRSVHGRGHDACSLRVAGPCDARGGGWSSTPVRGYEKAGPDAGCAAENDWDIGFCLAGNHTLRGSSKLCDERHARGAERWPPFRRDDSRRTEDIGFRLAGNTSRGGAAYAVKARYQEPPASRRFPLLEGWPMVGFRLAGIVKSWAARGRMNASPIAGRSEAMGPFRSGGFRVLGQLPRPLRGGSLHNKPRTGSRRFNRFEGANLGAVGGFRLARRGIIGSSYVSYPHDLLRGGHLPRGSQPPDQSTLTLGFRLMWAPSPDSSIGHVRGSSWAADELTQHVSYRDGVTRPLGCSFGGLRLVVPEAANKGSCYQHGGAWGYRPPEHRGSTERSYLGSTAGFRLAHNLSRRGDSWYTGDTWYPRLRSSAARYRPFNPAVGVPAGALGFRLVRRDPDRVNSARGGGHPTRPEYFYGAFRRHRGRFHDQGFRLALDPIVRGNSWVRSVGGGGGTVRVRSVCKERSDGSLIQGLRVAAQTVQGNRSQRHVGLGLVGPKRFVRGGSFWGGEWIYPEPKPRGCGRPDLNRHTVGLRVMMRPLLGHSWEEQGHGYPAKDGAYSTEYEDIIGFRLVAGGEA